MARLPIVLASLALLAAGCIQAPSDVDAASLELPVQDVALVAHAADGLAPLPEEFADLAVRVIDTPYQSGEPSIGVTSDGTIFVTAGGPDIARSTDDGATWELVGDPVWNPKRSLDPWVWVDTLTDRVFNAPLYVVCTWMAYSDDKGDSWSANPVAGCGIPAHDHQKITTGPPAEGVSTSGYPNVIYYQYNSFRFDGTWVTQSYDGGKTFTLGQKVHESDCDHGGVAGPVAVGPDGTAYLPKPGCDVFHIAVTRDSGETWEVTGDLDQVGVASALAVTVDAAVDAAGNAYAVWTGGDGLIYLTRSTDQGATWSDPVRVSPPDVTSTVFSVVSAGADGQVAVGYLGTTADTSKWKSENAEDAPDDTVWHLYMSFASDALVEDPVFVTQRVTPEDDPVQVGCVWQSGGANPCRNLLDFIDMVQHEGRAYLVFADGCDKCEKASDSRGRDVRLAVVETGPSLLGGALAPFGALVPEPVGEEPEGALARLA